MKRSRRQTHDDEVLRSINAAITTITKVSYSRRARRRIEERAGVALGPSAIATLAAIHAMHPTTNRAVGARVGLDPSRVSKEVRALVDEGLVEERRDASDRRVVLLAPTPAGERAYASYRDASSAVLGEVLAGWTTDDVTTLQSLLARLADGFTHPTT